MAILLMGAFGPLASARAAGSTTITLSVPPTVQVGGTTINATAYVSDANGPVVGDTLTPTATGTNPPTFGNIVDNQDGSYTIPITSSNAAGQYQITVSDGNGGSDTQPLTQTPGPATQLAVWLAPQTSITADGSSFTNIDAVAYDQFGNAVPGDPVQVQVAPAGPTVGSSTGTTDSTGFFTTTLTSSTVAGSYTITVTDTNPNSGASQATTLTQIPGPAKYVVVSLTPYSSIVADGVSQTTVQATVSDQYGNPIPNEPVTVTSNGPQPISAPTGQTNSSGIYATAITSTTTAGSYTITVTDTNPNITNVSGTTTLVQTAGPATQIQVQLSPSTITADGVSTATASATVTDHYGNPVPGDAVNVTSSSGGPAIAPNTTPTNQNGNYSTQLTSSTTAGSYTITATDTTAGIAGAATLTQAPGPAAVVQVSFLPYSSILADGVSTATVNATVTDHHGNPIAGDAVNVTSSSGGPAIAPNTTPTNQNGNYSTQLTSSTTAGSYTITATDTTAGIAGSATLTQLPGPAAAITLSLSSPALPADGHSTTTATATVVDQFNNRVPGDTITFAGGGHGIGPTRDNGDGTYSATVTATTTLGTSQITASDPAAGLASPPATLTQTLVQPYQLSLSLASPSLVADGSSQTQATVVATDAVGHPLVGDAVSVSDPSATISGGSGTTDGHGRFSATLTSSVIPGASTVTASDSTSGLSATAPLSQSAWLPNAIALAVSPTTITADGHSMATATITLADAQGRPRVGDLSLSLAASDPKVFIGAITGHPDGTYTAPITSSAAAGDVVLTAHEGLAGLSATTVLHQVHGAARTLAVALSSPVIRADGRSTATVTATIRDGAGNPVPGQLLHAAATDPRVQVGPASDHGNGTYTMQLTGSNRPGTLSVIVTDISAFPALSGEASLTEVPAPSLASVVTMQWSFFYSPSYTRVLSLLVSGAPAGSTILVHCQGAGCPGHRLRLVARRLHGCRVTARHRCTTPATFGLGSWLKGRRLHTGTKLIVEVTRPGWIGKYYSFKVQPGKGPRVRITCLAPGGTVPGQACS